MIVKALARAWRDLFRPRILSVVLLGVGLTILLFVALQAGLFWLIRAVTPGSFTLPYLGEIALAAPLSWGSLALFPLMGFFLMAPVAMAFSGLFTENVANAVEEIHYPAARPKSVDFWDSVLESFALVGASLLIGIVSLILTPFLGPLAPVLFYGANGWLLGREFFAMAARRHVSGQAASNLRRQLSGQIMALGVMIALLLSVPVLNIVIPVLAAAAFTHFFHLSQKSAQYRRE